MLDKEREGEGEIREGWVVARGGIDVCKSKQMCDKATNNKSKVWKRNKQKETRKGREGSRQERERKR